MVQRFTVNMKDMEVRKVEEVEIEINENTYRSLLVHFDDIDCNRLAFKDKIVENKEKYTRGTVGTLELDISTENVTKSAKNGKPYITEKTVMLIKDFQAK